MNNTKKMIKVKKKINHEVLIDSVKEEINLKQKYNFNY